MTVRTRIAPSPTGSPHIGTAYIALFNKAFSEKNRGEFLLRIEDSDTARSRKHHEAAIFDGLSWLGLSWDEGPDIDGPVGPYRTSERNEIYSKYLSELISAGGAFHCFCSKERLDEMRQRQQKSGELPTYDGRCAALTEDEVKRRLANDEPHTVRLQVPREGVYRAHDSIRGEIEIPWSQVDMQILRKSDNFPTYHLCAPIDDNLMRITHVLRGEEWINSIPKYALVYDYLGWSLPEFFHLPLLRNPDRSKLSKRRNPTGIQFFRDRGYLPEAVVNFLATLGWSSPDGNEMFSYEEFVKNFDTTRITTTAPVFDFARLDSLNGRYIRERYNRSEVQTYFISWINRHEHLESVAEAIQDRIDRFDQVWDKLGYLFGERRPLVAEDFTHKNLNLEDCISCLHKLERLLDHMQPFTSDVIQQQLRTLGDALDVPFRDLVFPYFIAISGYRVALPLFESMAILGIDIVRDRIRTAIEACGGISKKSRKTLDRDWEALGFS